MAYAAFLCTDAIAMQALDHDPAALRRACRSGDFDRPTAGLARGRVQANLVVVPGVDAADFLLFCQRNPTPCPLVEVLAPGAREAACAPGSDLATDLPRYRVYRGGELVEERPDVAALWRPDFVAFLIGCSFSFESALEDAGIALRHLHQGRNVAMYRTSRACAPAGRFGGEMVVSMRPIKSRDVAKVVAICARFPQAHGAPVHVGDPHALGIADLAAPDYGDAVEMLDDEVPVFWGCGVTAQWVAQRSGVGLCITHAPGKMFVTDLKG
jgi:uncharacterized protein YcsI (UPF0317 family)